jgi:predicted  nucleic acid-binding Zn ribbon protein
MNSTNKMKAGDDQAVKQEQDNEKVMHNYHDYANEVESGEEPGDLRLMEEHMQSSGMNHSGEQNFPVKLHYMLNELEKDGMDDIVSWQPHGRCFLVHKQQQFVEQVLPL